MDESNDYESNFEYPLGYVGLSSGPAKVYFDAVRDDANPYIYAVQDLTFNRFATNMVSTGSGMDLTSGVFTAPVDGTYEFTLTALRGHEIDTVANIYLMKNGNKVCESWTPALDAMQMSYIWMLDLNTSDQVHLRLGVGQFFATHSYPIHFTGKLL